MIQQAPLTRQLEEELLKTLEARAEISGRRNGGEARHS